MPTIPRYQQQVAMPKDSGGAVVNPSSAAAPYMAAAKVWKEVDDTALLTGRIYGYMQRAENAVQLQSAKLELDTKYNQLHADALKLGKKEEIDKLWEERNPAIMEEIASKYGENSQVWGQLKPFADHYSAMTQLKVNDHAHKMWKDDILARVNDDTQSLLQKIAASQEGSPDEWGYRNKLEEHYKYLIDNNIVNPTTVQKFKETQENQIETYRVQSAIQANPEMTKIALMERDAKGNFKNYPNLTIGQRADALDKADTRERSNRNQFYTDQHRYQMEVAKEVYATLDDPTVPDYKKIALIDKYSKEDPNTKFIGIEPSTAYHMKQTIRNGDANGGKTDFNVYARLYEKALPTEDNPYGTLTSAEIQQHWGRGLSTQDSKQLLSMITVKNMNEQEKEIKHLVDGSMKEFNTYIKAAYGTDSSKTAKQLAGVVLSDAQKVASFVKDKKGYEWFNNYLEQVKLNLAGSRKKKYLEKLQERLTSPGYYDEWFKGSRMEKGGRNRPGGSATMPTSQNEYSTMIQQTAGRYGIDGNLLEKLIGTESNFNPNAVSGKGAKGMGQLMDDTAKELGVKNVFDPAENVDGSARYLVKMLTMFDDDKKKAVAAYNAGAGRVKDAINTANKNGGSWEQYIPDETKNYLTKIFGGGQQQVITLSTGKKIRVIN